MDGAASSVIVTGASGLVGRHLLEALKDDWQVYAVARRSQSRAGIPTHPNIHWYQSDITDEPALGAAFRVIRAHGGADLCIHLATSCDFAGETGAERERTDVAGTRHVLDACRGLGLRHVVHVSGLAARRGPRTGAAVDEPDPAEGRSRSTRARRGGEDLLQGYAKDFRSVIVHLAPLFSDWCECPALFVLIQTWLSRAWDRRVLAGRGDSAMPYLHVHELAPFFLDLIDRLDELPQGQVLLASPDGVVSHRQLFDLVTREGLGRRVEPVRIPRTLHGPMTRLARLVVPGAGQAPGDNAWTLQGEDRALAVDARRTRELLHWSPRPRFEILRRLPFLIENRKMDPVEWNRRNQSGLEGIRLSSNLWVYQLLERHAESITADYTRALTGVEGRERFPSYQYIAADEHEWNHQLVLINLMNAVRTRERAVFLTYCRGLAERRFLQGFSKDEVCAALSLLNDICVRTLEGDPEAGGAGPAILQHVTMTLRVGIDHVEETFEDLEAARTRREQRLRQPRTLERGS